MALARSPLAPQTYPHLPPLAGVRLAACEAGIRYKNRTDLLLIELAGDYSVALRRAPDWRAA